MKLNYNLKTYIIFSGLIILIGILLYIYLNKNSSKPLVEQENLAEVEKEPYKNFNDYLNTKSIDYGTIAKDDNFKFLGDIPEKASIYNYKKADFSDSSINKYFESIGIIEPIKDTGEIMGDVISGTNKTNKTRLVLYNNARYLIYTFPISNTLPTKLSGNLDFYKNASNNILTNLNIDPSKYKLSQFAYYSGIYEPIIVNEQADATSISFIYESQSPLGFGLSDIDNTIRKNKLTIHLDGTGNPISVTIEPSGILNEGISEIPIKTQDEILESIENGDIILIDADVYNKEAVTLSTLKTAELSYRYYEGKIFPIILVTGTVTNADGETGTGYFYIDAEKK